jgi:hypothetical protein
MIRFSWESMVTLSNGSKKTMLKMLDILTNRHLYKISPLYYELSGDSFLINPEPLILNRRRVPLDQIVQYLELASLRNYLDFSFFTTITLPLEFAPYSKEELKSNRLITINNNLITFTYEEITWH